MATRSAKIDQKADLIWAIADKLTGVYKPHEYGDVILPLTVIRRFDCILSDTKDAVLQKYDEVKNLPMKDILLRKASKKDFYNTSKYTFERLMDDPDHIEENFREYLNKFSANVRDILEKFKFDGHITTMANKGILYIVLKEYTTDRGNLHPNEISNLEMGYIFEEIIRRFSESHNEDAGQHYTPREVIQLMVNILFYDDNDILSGNNVAKTIYDPACGTGGMLSVAEEYLHSLNASTELVSFGQEINDQTFAICKADMLIKGNNADYIKDGNTLSDDQFAGSTFDYILSNPPFGREWKNEKAKVEEEAKLGFGGRFGAGLPATSDGQMLFLMTAISKMKDIDKGGSRIAIIHNGSPLFTGDAGSGPSEIRRYILENDLLEAIIALPNDIFYNTGIATYIWVLSNKKAGTVREGKVQLINANEMFVKRRKALGNKRNDISKEDIAEITKIYGDFKESEISQIYDDEDFGYTKITVERPLRDEEGNLVLKKGKKQPDTSLRDTENVPLKEDIKEYFEREVLPFAPDAWVDEKKSKVGYEIPFTRFDVINLLSEQGAVDELGIGVIRDAFANYFFPGTSTIQTRAKYFLIVLYMLREAVDGRYGKDANRVLRAIDSAEKDCGIRLLEADPKAEGVIGSRVLPKGWVARKPSDIYWNGIRTFGIFCDYGLSIPEYVSLAVKLKEQKSVSRLGNRNDDAEENDKDDSDAGDIGNIRFWNLPIYHDDWRDNLTIELTQEEAFYLDKQIQKSTKGSLLEYVLKNRIDLNEYDDFASLTAELSEKVGEKLAYMMKLACDFNNLVYMARVRYNVMLSEDENTYANDEWSRLLPDIRHNATVDLDAVFGELQLINPRAKSFLCGIQAAFMASDIDMADELIRKRERSLKGAARAKLSRTKEFDHSKWVGGGMLDYRFSNARRIVNDIYAGEVSADV